VFPGIFLVLLIYKSPFDAQPENKSWRRIQGSNKTIFGKSKPTGKIYCIQVFNFYKCGEGFNPEIKESIYCREVADGNAILGKEFPHYRRIIIRFIWRVVHH